MEIGDNKALVTLSQDEVEREVEGRLLGVSLMEDFCRQQKRRGIKQKDLGLQDLAFCDSVVRTAVVSMMGTSPITSREKQMIVTCSG